MDDGLILKVLELLFTLGDMISPGIETVLDT